MDALFQHTIGWWRGHAKAEWKLQAQVFRREGPSSQEYALMGHFVSRAPSRSIRPCPGGNDYFGWLFLAQHYGVPTRLLDWSENPLVAAYFAVLDDPNDDGCIWALGTRGLNETFGVTADLVQIRGSAVREIAESAFTGIKPSDEREALAIDGQESDPRMLAQMSKFTIHSSRTPLEQVPTSADWLRQFVIPKAAKARIRKQLSAFGIRRSNLFPDLDSLATELKATFFAGRVG